ncbi:MAG: hypothetical protein HZA35_04285 [Parcubacteria group bacterium]|nr:hypothetical protein [Parcubacteria group bacterium]
MVQPKKEKGSMLIEAIVAISIFMVAFGSVLALNAQALHIVPQISKRLIASELAQEGVEIVRNHITTNAIRSKAFNDGINVDGYYPAFSDVSSEGPTVGVPCALGSCQTALFLPSGGQGNYTTNPLGKPTPFRRVVLIATGTHEVKVNSIVAWDNSIDLSTCMTSRDDCINIEDHLFDWQ